MSAIRPDNLYEPVSGDHGAHAGFNAYVADNSEQLWPTTLRGLLAGTAAVGPVLLGAELVAATPRRPRLPFGVPSARP